MFVAASTQCFADKPFAEACQQLTDLEYDKFEIWMDESSPHLKPSDVAANPERFTNLCRELTRLTPIAIDLAHHVPADQFGEICRVGTLLRITQITIPASPLGTPFNEEIDRLRARLTVASEAGIRLSLKTRTGLLTEDPHTAVELCQAVKGLGITLDPSYYLCHPRGQQPYDQIFPHVYHAHLRDTSASALQVPVGLGEIDYSRLVNQLRRFHYNRALSVELLPALMGDVDRALEMRKIRMLLETLL